MGQVLSSMGQQGGGYGGRQMYGGGSGYGRRPVNHADNMGGNPSWIGAPRQHPGASDPLGNPIDPTGGVNGPNGDWPGYYLGGGGALPKPQPTTGGGAYTGPIGNGPTGEGGGYANPAKGYASDGGGVSATPNPQPGTTVTNEGGGENLGGYTPVKSPTTTPTEGWASDASPQNPMRRRGRMFDGMY